MSKIVGIEVPTVKDVFTTKGMLLILGGIVIGWVAFSIVKNQPVWSVATNQFKGHMPGQAPVYALENDQLFQQPGVVTSMKTPSW